MINLVNVLRSEIFGLSLKRPVINSQLESIYDGKGIMPFHPLPFKDAGEKWFGWITLIWVLFWSTSIIRMIQKFYDRKRKWMVLTICKPPGNVDSWTMNTTNTTVKIIRHTCFHITNTLTHTYILHIIIPINKYYIALHCTIILAVMNYCYLLQLTRGLVTPYGNKDLNQHWLR